MPDQREQLNQVEWVDVNNGQPPTPSRNPRRWVMPVVVGIGALVLIGITIFVVQRVRENRRAAQQEANHMESAMNGAISTCEETENTEKCLENVAFRLAQESGNAKYCEALEPALADACYTIAAIASEDKDVCDEVEGDDARRACEEALVALTLDKTSIEACEGFQDEDLRNDCEADWVLEQVMDGSCDHEAISEEACSYGALIAQAQTAQDPDVCEEIREEEWRETCLILTFPGDRDFDGLTENDEEALGLNDRNPDVDEDGLLDGEEVNTYGTSPTHPDTDGDGYGDGLEVESGFDPLS